MVVRDLIVARVWWIAAGRCGWIWLGRGAVGGKAVNAVALEMGGRRAKVWVMGVVGMSRGW